MNSASNVNKAKGRELMRKWKAPLLFALILWSAGSALPAISADVIELLVVAHGTPDSVVDVGKKGPAAGDLNLWSMTLFDGKEKEQVGTDSGYCVRVSATEPVRQCSFTLKLKSGSVYVTATQTGKNGPFEGGIIGGTGEYANARGEVKYSPNEDFTKWTYNLRISK